MKARSIITRDSDPAGLIARLTMPPAFYKRVNETRFKQEWVLTHFQYLCLRLGWDGEGDPKHWMMSVFKGPRFQRGMLSGMGIKRAAWGAGPAGNVSISAHTLLDQRFDAGTCDARIEWQADGQLWAFRQVGSDFEYAGEWWTNEPESAGVGADYECRHISSGKTGTFSAGVEAAVADTWITISAARVWGVTRNVTGTKSCAATFEVGDDGAESADDSAILTTTATVDDV